MAGGVGYSWFEVEVVSVPVYVADHGPIVVVVGEQTQRLQVGINLAWADVADNDELPALMATIADVLPLILLIGVNAARVQVTTEGLFGKPVVIENNLAPKVVVTEAGLSRTVVSA